MNKAQHLATLLSKVGNTIHCLELEGLGFAFRLLGFRQLHETVPGWADYAELEEDARVLENLGLHCALWLYDVGISVYLSSCSGW